MLFSIESWKRHNAVQKFLSRIRNGLFFTESNLFWLFQSYFNEIKEFNCFFGHLCEKRSSRIVIFESDFSACQKLISQFTAVRVPHSWIPFYLETTTTTITTTTFIYTILVKEKERRKITKYRKQNNGRFIVIYIQVCELVCSSQSSKAFELAAAYLQITKGTKETNNNY